MNKEHNKSPRTPDVSELLQAIPVLRRLARRWSGSATAAEDLLQDTLERALRALQVYEPGTNAGAWMRTIMYRLAVDETRRRQRDGRSFLAFSLETPTSVTPIECKEAETEESPPPTMAELRSAGARLREPFRTTFDLWAVRRMSYLEISREMDVPLGTVSTRLLRARQALRGSFPGPREEPRPRRHHTRRRCSTGRRAEPCASRQP